MLLQGCGCEMCNTSGLTDRQTETRSRLVCSRQQWLQLWRPVPGVLLLCSSVESSAGGGRCVRAHAWRGTRRMVKVKTIRQCSTAVLSVCLRAAVATLRNKHERVRLPVPHAEQGESQRVTLSCLQLAVDCIQF